MAPSFSDVVLAMQRRQDQPAPSCVTKCLGEGDTTGCKSAEDFACLCASPPYLDSVSSCWQSSCDAYAISYGEQYAQKACAAFGVNLNVTQSGVPTNTSTGSNTTASASAAPQPTVDLYGDPVLYQKQFMNVQAIMSSICAAMFAIAIILGVLACRKKIKVDREIAQRSTWTGVGGTTFATSATKNGGNSSRFAFSRNAASSSQGVGDDSSNFDGVTTMGTLGYNQTNSFNGGIGSAPSRGLNRTGFTNRLTLGDMGEGEEWEMSAKSSPGEKPENFADSPTTSTMGAGKVGESTVDLGSDKGDGSTFELNTLPTNMTINGRAL